MLGLTPKRGFFAIFGMFAVLYGATVSRWLAHTDSPEFVSLLAMGGTAHPPGYPTVVLVMRAFSWVPIDPRIAAGLVTAAAGAAAISVLFLAARAWGAPLGSSALAAILVGLNSQVWLVHTHPEAFAFNDLSAALILWLSAPSGPLTGVRRGAILGLVGGLALGAHQSIVLLAPVGLYGVYRAYRESDRGPMALLAGAALFASGLSVYFYLMFADSPVSFGRVDTFSDLIDHFLRREYGTTKLAAQGESGPGEQLAFFFTESVLDFAVVGFCLGLLGAIRIVATEADAPAVPLRERPAVFLIAAWLLAGPLFVVIFNTSPEGPNFEIVKRFHVLPAILMGPLIAWALERFTDTGKRLKWGAIVITLGIFLSAGLIRTKQVYSTHIEDWIVNALETAPPEAIIVSQGDHRHFGTLYFQEVGGRRADVTYVTAIMLGMPWYVDRLREKTGLPIPQPTQLEDGTRKIDLRGVLDVFLASGRPVSMTAETAPEVLAEYRSIPEGVGFRLLREEESIPTPAKLVERNIEIYSKFTHRSQPPIYEQNRWGWSVFSSYFAVWGDLVRRCEEVQDTDCAEKARAELAKYPDL